MNLIKPARKLETSPLRMLIVVALVLVVGPFTLLLVDVLRDGPLVAIDTQIANRLNAYNAEHNVAFEAALVVTRLGSTGVLTAVTIVGAAVLTMTRKRRQALFLITTALLGSGLNNLVKVVVGRDRPHFDTGE